MYVMRFFCKQENLLLEVHVDCKWELITIIIGTGLICFTSMWGYIYMVTYLISLDVVGS